MKVRQQVTIKTLWIFLLSFIFACQQPNQEKNEEPPADTSAMKENPAPETHADENKIAEEQPLDKKIKQEKNIFAAPIPHSTSLTYKPGIYSSQPSQIFLINSEKDTIIISEEGVRVLIPANSFNVKNKFVKIKLEEYVTMSQIFFSGMSLTSNGDLLETGGMVNIRAFADGKEIDLRKGSKISVQFPKENQEKKMNLFYGHETANGINWVGDTTEQTTTAMMMVSKDSTISLNPKKEYSYRFSALCGSALRNFECPIFKTKDTSFLSKYGSYDVSAYFEKNLIVEDTILKLFYDRSITVNFRVDKKGLPYEIKIGPQWRIKKIKRVTNIDLENRIINLVTSLPLMKRGSRDRIKRLLFQSRKSYKQAYDSTEYLNAFEKKYANSSSFNASDVDYYIFTSSKLGWINCDRYPDIGSPQKDFFVQLDNRYSTTVKVVFRDFKSITELSSKDNHNFTFLKKISSNLNIKIVVLQKRAGKTFYAIKESNTNKALEKDFEFRELNLALLKKEIAELDD